ncbi:GyrI-like domain-containing protein [Legionella yabuuchiae]|uniref:GyrI-like domain-containing protein n=1 Tax=Legionella yabuuchiae TaxID=376727 RepID=UPI001054A449|nr:GyrI-like domain-containing protein [Legionella yabuuchiae]
MSFAQPIVKYVDSFTVTGLSVRTQNSIEFDETMAKLPKLWQKFNSSNPTIDKTVFGVYSDYETDVNGFYTVTAGIASANEVKELSSVKITSGNYLIFRGEGEMPKAIIDTWKTVWNYFTADSPYKRSFMTDFEAYSNGDEVAIYIGIK